MGVWSARTGTLFTRSVPPRPGPHRGSRPSATRRAVGVEAATPQSAVRHDRFVCTDVGGVERREQLLVAGGTRGLHRPGPVGAPGRAAGVVQTPPENGLLFRRGATGA